MSAALSARTVGLTWLRERPPVDYREPDSFSEEDSWNSDELEYLRQDAVHIDEAFIDEVKDEERLLSDYKYDVTPEFNSGHSITHSHYLLSTFSYLEGG